MKICLIAGALLVPTFFCGQFDQTYLNTEWKFQHAYSTSSQPHLLQSTNLSGNLLQGIWQVDNDLLILTCLSAQGDALWQHDIFWENGQYATIELLNDNSALIAGSAYHQDFGNNRARLLKMSGDGDIEWTLWSSTDWENSTITALSVADSSRIWLTTTGWTGSTLEGRCHTVGYDGVAENTFGIQGIPVSIAAIQNQAKVMSGWTADGFIFKRLSKVHFEQGVQQELDIELPFELPEGIAGIHQTNDGHFYMIAHTLIAGNQAIQVWKINPQLEIDWTNTIQEAGTHLIAKAVASDDTGNLYVTGVAWGAEGISETLLARLEIEGNSTEQRMLSHGGGCSVSGESIAITGETICIIEAGCERAWIRAFDQGLHAMWSAPLIHEIGTHSIESCPDGVIVQTGTVNEATISRYTWYQSHGELGGDELHCSNQVVVRFREGLVDDAFLQDPSKRFGQLAALLPPALLDQMNAAVGFDLGSKGVVTKVFPWVQPGLSPSISRGGEEVSLEGFENVMMIHVSDAPDCAEWADDLGALFPMIRYAVPHHVLKLMSDPDDEYYVSQLSLASHDASFGGINAVDAWERSTGSAEIRVGVVDEIIDWAVLDFGSGAIGDGVIKGGYNYVQDFDLELSDLPSTDHYHGTACAGIIGARRNDGLGVAGIAGGDIANGIDGVSMYSLVIFEDQFAGVAQAANAIVQGASDINDGTLGFGLHAMNLSWGGPEDPLLKEAIEYAWLNDCMIAAARGNSGSDQAIYPACYNDEQVFSCGACGSDGVLLELGEDNYASSYGQNMDVLAPGNGADILTTFVTAPLDPIEESAYCLTESNYTCFRNTSAATAHATGTIALGLAYGSYMDYLFPEDQEHLIQLSCADPSNATTVGYSETQGWGRIDAGAYLQFLDPDLFQLIQLEFSPQIVQTDLNANIHLSVAFEDLGVGDYSGESLLLSQELATTLLPTDIPFAEWPRLHHTTGISSNLNYLGNNHEGQFVTSTIDNEVHVNCSIQLFHITADGNGNALDTWIPCSPEEARGAYSLLIKHQSTQWIEEPSEAGIALFPNPTEGTIHLTCDLSNFYEWEILDHLGRKVHKGTFQGNAWDINVESLPQGAYSLRLHVSENKQYSIHFIKL
ncbi:MAG: S8 family peptidase [Flavobacteriales bacterium]|nr:S8 family peptidase [Flavobacteriales bacterium]